MSHGGKLLPLGLVKERLKLLHVKTRGQDAATVLVSLQPDLEVRNLKFKRFLSCQSPASFSEERECPGLLTGLWWILTHSGMLHPNLNKKHTHTQDAPLPSSTTPRTQTETWALTVRAPMDPHG